MARTQAGAHGIGALGYLEPYQSWNAVWCNGSRSSQQAVCNRFVAATEVSCCSGDRRIANGLGSAPRLWLQHRRVCRWGRLGIAAWLAVVFGRHARMPRRPSVAFTVWPLASVAMLTGQILVLVIGVSALFLDY